MVSLRKKARLRMKNGGVYSVASHVNVVVNNGNLLNDDTVVGNDVVTTLTITTTTTTNNVAKPKRSISKKTKNKRKSSNRIPPPRLPPPVLVPEVPGPLLSEIIKFYGPEAVPCLVMEKALTATDLIPQQGRLSFPYEKIMNKDRHCWVDKDKLHRKEDESKFLNVRVLDPKCVWNDEVKLKIWKSGSGAKLYVLTGRKDAWNKIVKSNLFKEKEVLRVWSFRVQENNTDMNGDENQSKICFVIAKK